MRKLNNKGPWCSMCTAYGHSDTKCPNLDKHLDTLAMVISTHTLGDEWLDESGALDLQMLVDHSNRLLNVLHESMKALEASGKLGTNGLPLKGSRNLLYKAIMAKKKQHNYKIAGEKRRGQSRTRASKCGYCRNVGHTRRTCETMKKDQTLVLNANRLYRKQFAARMNSLSLGAGSLLKFTLNNEGVVGRNHGWYKNYPDSFLSIVPELAFKDCTVFNMITSYDYMHRAVINHHLIANTDVNAIILLVHWNPLSLTSLAALRAFISNSPRVIRSFCWSCLALRLSAQTLITPPSTVEPNIVIISNGKPINFSSL